MANDPVLHTTAARSVTPPDALSSSAALLERVANWNKQWQWRQHSNLSPMYRSITEKNVICRPLLQERTEIECQGAMEGPVSLPLPKGIPQVQMISVSDYSMMSAPPLNYHQLSLEAMKGTPSLQSRMTNTEATPYSDTEVRLATKNIVTAAIYVFTPGRQYYCPQSHETCAREHSIS